MHKNELAAGRHAAPDVGNSLVKGLLLPYRVGEGMHFGSTAILSRINAMKRDDRRLSRSRKQRLAVARNEAVVLGFRSCAVAYIGRRRFEGRNDGALSNTRRTMQRKKPRLDIWPL